MKSINYKILLVTMSSRLSPFFDRIIKKCKTDNDVWTEIDNILTFENYSIEEQDELVYHVCSNKFKRSIACLRNLDGITVYNALKFIIPGDLFCNIFVDKILRQEETKEFESKVLTEFNRIKNERDNSDIRRILEQISKVVSEELYYKLCLDDENKQLKQKKN
jgi:hypothetical protein